MKILNKFGRLKIRNWLVQNHKYLNDKILHCYLDAAEKIFNDPNLSLPLISIRAYCSCDDQYRCFNLTEDMFEDDGIMIRADLINKRICDW